MKMPSAFSNFMLDRTSVSRGLYEYAFGIFILHASFTEGVRRVFL
jgi:hypothetical protein